MDFKEFMKARGKAAPRKRPRRVARKLAARLGYMRYRPGTAREATDRFMAWSSWLGHQAGEALNRAVASRLKN